MNNLLSIPPRSAKDKIKVCVLVGEYFGAMGTKWGGYGFLARHIIGKMMPKYSNTNIEVILGQRKDRKFSRFFVSQQEIIDGIRVIRLPKIPFFAKRFLSRAKYDAYLSIEFSGKYALKNDSNPKIPWIFWIQDPRPWYEWREINSVSLVKERCRWSEKQNDFVNIHASGNGFRKIHFISQAMTLNEKAMDLYRLENNVRIDFVPNPVELPEINEDEILSKKENRIVFLGRLDEVKRAWLFCEIAKACPEYEFLVLGKTSRQASLKAIEKYRSGIPNLKFVGHVEGDEKFKLLSSAKILVNTSIHEALPVSFIEALSVGTLIVSNQNPDALAERFGRWVGRVSGDGFEAVPKFVGAVRDLLSDSIALERTARAAMKYAREVHAPEIVFPKLEKIIRDAIRDVS